MERWRQPVIPVAVDTAPTEYAGDGHGWRKHVDWTLTPEDFGRVKAGYVCINCMEPHERPFPENCSLCGFQMRAKQPQMVEYEFRGEKHIGPSTSLDEEAARLEEWSERQKDKKPSIWVPRAP